MPVLVAVLFGCKLLYRLYRTIVSVVCRKSSDYAEDTHVSKLCVLWLRRLFVDMTWSMRRNCCLFNAGAHFTCDDSSFFLHHKRMCTSWILPYFLGNVIRIWKIKWDSKYCLTLFITKLKQWRNVVCMMGFPR